MVNLLPFNTNWNYAYLMSCLITFEPIHALGTVFTLVLFFPNLNNPANSIPYIHPTNPQPL